MSWWIICPMLRVMRRESNRIDFSISISYALILPYIEIILPWRDKRKMSLTCIVCCRFDVESIENGGSVPDNRKLSERSVEDLTKNTAHSATQGMTRAARAFTVRSVTSQHYHSSIHIVTALTWSGSWWIQTRNTFNYLPQIAYSNSLRYCLFRDTLHPKLVSKVSSS